MKKKIMESGMALLLLAGIFLLAREGARITAGEVRNSGEVVVIDAGHGGSDPGKIGIHQEKEKDLNLQIALLLQKELDRAGISVIMTRTEDCELADSGAANRKARDLRRRCEIISKNKPVCAVSIHQNSYPEEAVKGAQTFYYQDSAEGKHLAEILQNFLCREVDPENRRQAKGNRTYYLLKKTEVPVAIVECGFLSNAKEADLLAETSYQKKLAHAIGEGILCYINHES